jgi:hypothetical protein
VSVKAAAGVQCVVYAAKEHGDAERTALYR